MTRLKICTVVGARPQFIKAAAVSAAIRQIPQMREILVHTGQHFDTNMSDVFFDQLGLVKPDHSLGIGGGGHGEQTARMLVALEAVMMQEKPDWILIFGDTNSTLAGAMAAAKLNIPIAHVEAGLRSFNRRMPEEINRVVADHLSGLLFAPTELAVRQLANEGITTGVHMVGDVMYDIAKKAMQTLPALPHGLVKGSFALATIHRAENTDDPARLRAIFDGLVAFARDVRVVLPLHPRTRKALTVSGLLEDVSRQLTILDPLGYADMLALEAAARLVITDSGGVQKEAYFQGVPCVTLRDETEWVELVETGWNRVCPPTGAEAIIAACRAALDTTGEAVDLYGGGNASGAIAALLAAQSGV